MAVLKSGASTDAMTIDATSKAARISVYDSLGTYRGPKATYRASVTDTVAAPSGSAPFFIIEGSGTKTIVVQRILISCPTIAAVLYRSLVVSKYSTAISGGTPTTLTKVPVDSNSAAATANTCQVYTAAPTAGTLVGAVAARRGLLQATTAVANGIPFFYEFDFRVKGSENTPIVLRGTSQGLGVNWGSSPAATTTFALEVEWTEE